MIYALLTMMSLATWKLFFATAYYEHAVLMASLTGQSRDKSGGWFGTSMRASFLDLIHIDTLEPSLLPKPTFSPTAKDSRRLIFIGDVHGCRDELLALLNAVSFDPETDHLLLTGDLISKGPDSRGVVNIARKLSASCVRGNHEDRVLLVHRDLSAANLLPIAGSPTADEIDTEGSYNGMNNAYNDTSGYGTFDYLDEGSYSPLNERDRRLAHALSPAQVEYLSSCPVILRVGPLASLGEILLVHAGLVAGVSLESQDPSSVMSMRTVDLDTHVPSKKRAALTKEESEKEGRVEWAKLWNKHQSLLGTKHFLQQPEPSSAEFADKKSKPPPLQQKHTTVIYGHDAHSGLQLQPYTKGLDTGCHRGGKLTALVVGDGGKQKVFQVDCLDYRKLKTQEGLF